MLGELQQAPFDEGVRVVSERADQFRLLTTKVLVHLRAPASYLSCQFSKSGVLGEVWLGSQFPQESPAGEPQPGRQHARRGLPTGPVGDLRLTLSRYMQAGAFPY